jgi:uncharacterized membrane protein
MKLEPHVKQNGISLKNLLATVLSLQIAMWALMGLNVLGVSIPIVQPLIGFIYLTFVPGILVLTVLRLRNLPITEIMLYTVGLSVTVVMSVGLVDDLVLSALNIIGPFSFLAVTTSMSLVVLVLCAIAYFRNRSDPKPIFSIKSSVPLTPTLFLCVIPLITVFSTRLVNTYNVDAGQLALYLILAIIVLVIAFDKFIPSKLYPLAVFAIALSLLFHETLISEWLVGWDIQTEYALAHSVLSTGVWNPNASSELYNAMLSVVAFGPIYSIISSLDLAWVFKLVYPVIFALVPVVLYQAFRRQLSDKVAFLSCFFFVSISTYWTELTGLAREEIGQFFCVLMILLLVSKEMNPRIRSLLFIVFGLSLVASHYGMAYIFLLFLFVLWLVLTVTRVDGSELMPLDFRTKIGIRKDKQAIAPSPTSPRRSPVTISVISLLFIASFAWYAYTAQAGILGDVVSIGSNISSSMGEMFNPRYSEGLQAAVTYSAPPSIVHKVSVTQQYFNQFLILAGVFLTVFLKKQRFKLQFSYVILSSAALGLLVASVAVPFFAALDWDRMYQIASIILAPFLVIGAIKIVEIAGVVKNKFGFRDSALVNPSRLVKLFTIVLAIYLIVFMLFQTDFLFIVTQTCGSVPSALNIQGGAQFNHQEFVGATWLVNKSDTQPIYGNVELATALQSLASVPPDRSTYLPPPSNASANSFYIYLGTDDIARNQFYRAYTQGVNRIYYWTNVTDFCSNESLIYSNGGARVYW